MGLDFEREYGVNAGYVQALFEDWKRDAESVDESWQRLFERAEGPAGGGTTGTSAPTAKRGEPQAALPQREVREAAEATPKRQEDTELELLSGIAGRIASNMEDSLTLPTATSVRTLPAKVLSENRSVMNEHMAVRALGKTSFTHIIAYALAKALGEMPHMVASYVEREGRAYRRVPQHINLGLAIDVPGPKGRMLVVPNIKSADAMDFRTFREEYEALVQRGRQGELEASDYQDTNVTLTNPGGFGTEMSVPRLMKGQGLIVATGTIGVPPQVAGASDATLAAGAFGPVMTMTSTYDHRVIQGAESGLFLKRVEELLTGEDGFYEEVFAGYRVPWKPYEVARDLHGPGDDATNHGEVWNLINAYRVRGWRLADLDPLEYDPAVLKTMDPGTYGFTVWDLDRTFLCSGMSGKQEMTLREILAVLRRAYCRRWSVEYMHIVDRDKQGWVRESVEGQVGLLEFTHELRMQLLERLYRAENFERFLHTQYPGNKRFSLEGADTLIPALAEIIDRAAERGVERVVIGMAHRGRLNVLANILGKSYEQIFREFQGVLLPLSVEGSGDVKYHLGQRGVYHTRTGRTIDVYLCPNPSHLEAVDPVVCGMTRAYQDAMRDVERKSVLAVLIHGDAAFSGQGVVAETLNMSQLPAFRNGGTVHLVVNNQIGFTAGPRSLRSTYSCTDVAKSVQALILKANGDYPESVMRAVHLGVDYQREFGEDAVIDMVCYRRWGHNEGDEPAYTQPILYSKIRRQPTVVESYIELLRRRQDIEEHEIEKIRERYAGELAEARAKSNAPEEVELPLVERIDLDDDEFDDYVHEPSMSTGVARDELVGIIDRCNKMPEGHVVHPNLLRQLHRREGMVRGERGVDWGCAEALAFGSLLREAVSVRLCGQDSGRGTFSHRHAVIRDQLTEKDYVPLKGVGRGGADFDAWDSFLSEEAVLGFEYGYSLTRPDALVLWEAQFGDFANGAQVAIDQFIVSGEAKWKEKSGVTLLLPHGFDGQGPEHSSGRPERFLALCSKGNLTVANCTTSAQYFHLLRRQGLLPDKRPLVVFTPKSLLRDKRAASSIDAFVEGTFREVLPDPTPPQKAARILICTGKLYYELVAYREEHGVDDVEILRLEQLYPLPLTELESHLARHPGARVFWCQEEPRNMGAWTYMFQRFHDHKIAIDYCGRPESSSPASGSYRRHGAQQEYLIERAFKD
ncbi:MAG: multifunctional oxoglutarate decarboxylase/oxoglutarate dehydrogenase thiamine pyrophosphate-binding subunit/dihydrolipoyllysine-residue succinyltransferase subunit [Planctomycetes bacterium]|jgi:2-oxoglutarate dehydrogenase E1 component|nr:multifunctional oxoglutarate decarboxylase/oxoglutarate dehydrogenase thiamine pyrophosphate-binding subunit/dihydrolipoyllysine-residue succinyltransferase subunit [Planctomycetota bacterium]